MVYLEVKMAGSFTNSIEGSVQFRILVASEESRNWDSLNVQLPQERVSDAEGPATALPMSASQKGFNLSFVRNAADGTAGVSMCMRAHDQHELGA